MAKQQPDPNNLEIKKGYVFNETGNIMMASTDMTDSKIEKDGRIFKQKYNHHQQQSQSCSTMTM